MEDLNNKVVKYKLNAPLRNFGEGTIIDIKTDKHGIPLERYWRDRLKESALDGCIEEFTEKSEKKVGK